MRHEDQLGVDRSQNGFIMFFRRTDLSIIPTFQERAEAWKGIKSSRPQDLTMSLRAALFMAMLKELHNRLEATKPGEATETLIQLNHLTKELQLPYLEYQPDSKSMTIKKDMEPISLEDMKKRITRLLELSPQAQVIVRFPSTRPLPGDTKSEVIPFVLQVGHRTQAAMEMWSALHSLCYNSA